MTAATLTLTGFLLARIAEDEAAARASGWDGPCYECQGASGGVMEFDPTRVLAECEAKRRIVALIREAQVRGMDEDHDPYVLRALAAVYADHPDYRTEWRP